MKYTAAEVKDATNRYRAERRAVVLEAKSKPCTDFGGTFPPECMDFDHLDSSMKVKNIARMMETSIKKLRAEISKCELVCANCHRIRTELRRKRRAGLFVRCALPILLFVAFSSCVHRVPVKPPEVESRWKGPITSPDGSYFYWTDDKGVWVFVSKKGPTQGERELCPHGSVCNIDTVGQMYILKRGN